MFVPVPHFSAHRVNQAQNFVGDGYLSETPEACSRSIPGFIGLILRIRRLESRLTVFGFACK
jgi:hypothetical protein